MQILFSPSASTTEFCKRLIYDLSCICEVMGNCKPNASFFVNPVVTLNLGVENGKYVYLEGFPIAC